MSKADDPGGIIRDVDFPRFTTSIINGVFETLQGNHLAQIEAYSELMAKTAKTLSLYVKENSNEVNGEEVIGFLSQSLSAPLSKTGSDNSDFYSLGDWYDSGTGDAIETLKGGKETEGILAILEVRDDTNKVIENEKTKVVKFKTKEKLLEAVRKRVAAQRYGVLAEMVRMGMMRLVVEDGEINTRVTFKVTERQIDRNRARDFSVKTKSGGFRGRASILGGRLGISGGYSSASTTVRTVDTSSFDMQNLNIDLFGSVNIKFKTDYFPLNPNQIGTVVEPS